MGLKVLEAGLRDLGLGDGDAGDIVTLGDLGDLGALGDLGDLADSVTVSFTFHDHCGSVFGAPPFGASLEAWSKSSERAPVFNSDADSGSSSSSRRAKGPGLGVDEAATYSLISAFGDGRTPKAGETM